MPFVSRAQQRYAFATDQPWAKEFAKATTNYKGLPQHVKPKANRNRAALARQTAARRSK